MGHTTRCVPIIRHLKSRGHSVILAGNEQQRDYWTNLFPDVLTLPLQGYDVRYGKEGMRATILRQLPKILRAVSREYNWLQQVVKAQRIDAVISDNRYGLHYAGLPTVIITHQLSILTGMGKFVDGLLRRLHYRFLNRFSVCWVPDLAKGENLAGALSHPASMPANTQYLGLLSALKPTAIVKDEHLLILLSGPEPQRSILSEQLWLEAINMTEPIVFVEGTAAATYRTDIPDHIHWYPRLGGDALQAALDKASVVVCRSGYSTLMDLALVQKRAILIPTPGQTEQEYLATYQAAKGAAVTFSQKEFSLAKALKAVHNEAIKALEFDGGHFTHTGIIDEWLKGLGESRKP